MRDIKNELLSLLPEVSTQDNVHSALLLKGISVREYITRKQFYGYLGGRSNDIAVIDGYLGGLGVDHQHIFSKVNCYTQNSYSTGKNFDEYLFPEGIDKHLL